MTLDFDLIREQLPDILSGLLVTVTIWCLAALGSVVAGFAIAIARRYGSAPVRGCLRVFVDVIRGTPFLVQIFLLYFGGPFVGLKLEAFSAGLFALTIYGAAYFSEIFRAGIAAIPKGHIEAAECVGLNRMQIIRRILLPEMTMLVLPQCINMTIILLKDTAILSIITVPEMTLVIGAIGSQQYAYVEAMLLLALLYWVLVETCGAFGRACERRLSKYRFSS